MIFFINQFLPIFPVVVLWLVYFGALAAHFKREWLYRFTNPKALLIFLGRFANLKALLIFTAAFRVFQALLLSIAKYYIWSQSAFTQQFINSPISPDVPFSNFLRENLSFIFDSKLGYFLLYSWGRFWVSALLAIAVAAVFYIFLKALKKYNSRFFNEGEVELGFLLALVVGWPSFVIFIPLVFASVILVSVFRGLYFKEAYTTLGIPMLLAALITMIFGANLIEILGLAVLKI